MCLPTPPISSSSLEVTSGSLAIPLDRPQVYSPADEQGKALGDLAVATIKTQARLKELLGNHPKPGASQDAIDDWHRRMDSCFAESGRLADSARENGRNGPPPPIDSPSARATSGSMDQNALSLDNHPPTLALPPLKAPETTLAVTDDDENAYYTPPVPRNGLPPLSLAGDDWRWVLAERSKRKQSPSPQAGKSSLRPLLNQKGRNSDEIYRPSELPTSSSRQRSIVGRVKELMPFL